MCCRELLGKPRLFAVLALTGERGGQSRCHEQHGCDGSEAHTTSTSSLETIPRRSSIGRWSRRWSRRQLVQHVPRDSPLTAFAPPNRNEPTLVLNWRDPLIRHLDFLVGPDVV